MKHRPISPHACARVLLAADKLLAGRFTKQQEQVAEQFAKPHMADGFSSALSVWADSLLPKSAKSGWLNARFFIWVTILGFLLMGLLSQALGSGQSVNVILNPFMALLVWQALVLSFWTFSLFLPQSGNQFAKFLRPLFTKWDRHWAKPQQVDNWPRWLSWTLHTKSQLWQLQGQILLNVAFISFTFGLLIGMAIRGLAQNYAFHWESTFFHDPVQIQAFLDGLFWPVQQLSPIAVPRLGPINEPMPGRDWFLLYAWASVFYLLLPRLIWLASTLLKKARWIPEWPSESPFDELRRVWRQESPFHARIHPYSYNVSAERMANGGALLSHLFGSGSRLEWQTPLEWGADATTVELADEPTIILVKGLHTPEEEIHGQLLRQLNRNKRKNRPALWVDVADLSPNQRSERLVAWDQMAKAYGLASFGVDLAAGECLDPDRLFAWGHP
ncbi:MAG: DUF2868 domain-containing protein [Acidobacteria bacterium]|nr:DUF2868 domain-containing protein [Acidobacteriota bacterium]